MDRPVRVAVVGASGGMGAQRLEQFSNDPRCRLVAACGREVARLRQVVSDDSVRLVTDPAEVYAASDVEAVVISIPNALHYQHVKSALGAGKHVMCEYPLADDLGRYDELAALAKAGGVVLHHSLTVRAESLHLTMKQALARLGQPRAVHYRYYGGGGWYADPALRGDMFCAFHIHFIEQYIDLFGQPARIIAHGVERDGIPSASVMMQWPTGLAGTMEFGAGLTDRPGYTGMIVTTNGYCGFVTQPDTLVTVGQGGRQETIAPPEDQSQLQDARSFLDEILGTGGPQSDLAAGRNAIALCLECSKQLAAGS